MGDDTEKLETMTEGTKKSKFEEMTSVSEVAERVSAGEFAEEERGAMLPGTIFTRDARPDAAKMKIPNLRLAQGMTEEVTNREAQIGNWLLENFGPEDEVLAVPIATQNIRRYRPDPRKPAQCVAPTGVHGVGDPGIVCAQCPLSKWGARDPRTGKSAPPKCQEGVSMLAYSITHGMVIKYDFMGQNIGKGQFIQTQAVARNYGNFALRMTAGTSKNEKGSWAEPKLQMVPQIPEEEKELAQTWLDIMTASMPDTAEATAALLPGNGS